MRAIFTLEEGKIGLGDTMGNLKSNIAQNAY